MIPLATDIGALHLRLGKEIDQALQTSDRLGTTVVGCYLQMARDVLDGSMDSPPDLAKGQEGCPETDP